MADVNSFLLQAIQAAPGHLRVRVLHGGHDAGNARGNQRVAARRRSAVMTAGFQRHIGSGAPGFFAGHAQRMNFRMRLAGTIVKTFADNLAVLDDHTADIRIGMGRKAPALRQLKRSRHVHFIMHGLVL
ncbi:Uncharacterised protein [Raoultella ornithinolytica]|nr:Uncharacterised protein [Raoultella ornithinolytica]